MTDIQNQEIQENPEKNSRLTITKNMSDSTAKWNAIVKIISDKLKGDIKDAVDIQADAMSYRQCVIDEIKTYSVKIYKLVQKMKVLEKLKFEYYTTKYSVKTNSSEKTRLINADLSEHQAFINELDEHVNFLRETAKHLDSVNYSVKNKIEVANITGGYK